MILHPTIYRYFEWQFVDAFWQHGELRLSSFARFAQHADEQRLDADEGKTTVICRTPRGGGQTMP